MNEKIKHKLLIRDLPEHKKPREKMAERGVESLKDHELLAVLLGSGYHGQSVLKVSKRLFSEHPLEEFVKLPLDKLKKLKGIEPNKSSWPPEKALLSTKIMPRNCQENNNMLLYL